MPHKYRLLLGLIILLVSGSATAAGDPLAAQREQFIEARKALKQNQLDRYRELAAGLKSYPLHPYLEFDALRARLGDAGEREVLDFAKRHADTPLAARVKSLWLYTLASQRRWELFLKHYRKDILKFFPDFSEDSLKELNSAYILRDMVPALLLLYKEGEGEDMEIVMDYATPQFRDFKSSSYFFDYAVNHLNIDTAKKKYFKVRSAVEAHDKYLIKMGFERIEDTEYFRKAI